jgi:hypothetical protein
MAQKTRQFHARFTGIFTACVLLIQLLGMGPMQIFCAMTGTVGDSCCCPEKAENPDRESPTVESAPCCEVLQPANQVQARNFELPTQELKTPLWVAVPEIAPMTPPRVTATTQAPRLGGRDPPPDRTPALYIQNCSYLI